MINHIKPQDIEKLIISPEEFTHEEREPYIAHIETCALCKENFSKLREFYSGFEKELSSPPTERDKSVAQKLFSRKRSALPWRRAELSAHGETALDTYYETVEPYKRPLPQRIYRYIQLHPIKFVGATSFASIAMVLAFFLVKPAFEDTNPSYARAKDEFLVVYNKNGKELGRNHIGYDYDAGMLEKQGFLLPNYLITSDIDNDGKNEILALFGFIDCPQPMKNTLYCYNSDGTEKWHKEFHWSQKFGDEVFADNYSTHSMLVHDFDQDGKKDIITLLYSGGYYPSVVVKTDPTNGNTISEYWSSGAIHNMTFFDYNNDGIDEIFLTGENNGYNLASLAILDPRYFIGHTPAPPSYTPHGVSAGREQYYILFPRNDLRVISSHKRNMALSVFVQDVKSFFVQVHELVDKNSYFTLFHFNSSMECTKVDGEDRFVALHQKLEREGKLTKKLDAQYYENLRKGVLYWNGEKFVNKPTINKWYLTQIATK